MTARADYPAYIPAIDGLRAFSILAVLAYHGGGFLSLWLGQCGWLGVDIFFVISGFLISRLAMAELRRNGSLNVRRFFINRILRITPAIWVLLSVYAIISPHGSPSNLTAVTIAAVNLTDYDLALGHTSSIQSGLAFCWSLAVEEKFYLLFPLMILFYRRFRSPASLLLLLVLAEVWKYSQITASGDSIRMLAAFDTRFDEILIGCVAASLLDRKQDFCRFLNFFTLPLVAPALMLGIVYFMRHFMHPSVLTTLGQKQVWWLISMPLFSIMVALLLVSLTISYEKKQSGILSRVLGWAPFVAIGKLSYSLYLWHSLAFFCVLECGIASGLIQDLLKLILSLGFAYVSYALIEQPFLTIKKRLAQEKAVNAVPLSDQSLAEKVPALSSL